MKLHFALVGNQNCGKSTLFNYLTGSNQHVGNFPGVTVQKKEGTILAVPDAGVIDLPGIYSLSPYTSEEIVTRDLLLYNKPDAIINVIDATNIERSLYLSLQLIELNIPMVIALNMMDELTGSGGSIDIKAMEDSLTVPVVPITANSGEGVGELLRRAVEVAQNQQLPQRLDFCSGPVHTAIHSIAHLIETKARRQNLPLRFTATKLIEGTAISPRHCSFRKTNAISSATSLPKWSKTSKRIRKRRWQICAMPISRTSARRPCRSPSIRKHSCAPSKSTII